MNVDLKMKLSTGKDLPELTEAEAREVYLKLHEMFGVDAPTYPYIPVYPAHPDTVPPYNPTITWIRANCTSERIFSD